MGSKKFWGNPGKKIFHFLKVMKNLVGPFWSWGKLIPTPQFLTERKKISKGVPSQGTVLLEWEKTLLKKLLGGVPT